MIVRIARGGLRDFWDNNERMVSGQMGFVEQSLWVATMTVVFAVMMAALWIVAREWFCRHVVSSRVQPEL